MRSSTCVGDSPLLQYLQMSWDKIAAAVTCGNVIHVYDTIC